METVTRILLIVSQLSPEDAWDVLRYAVLWLVRNRLAGFSELYALQSLRHTIAVEEAA